jgi:chromosome segregation ATPase
LKINQLEKTIKSLTIVNGEKDAKIHDLENEVQRLQDIEN